MNPTGKGKISRKAYDRLGDFCCPSGLDTEERARRTLTGLIAILTIPVLFGYALFHLYSSRFQLAGGLFVSCLVIVAIILPGRKVRNAKAFYRTAVVLIGFLFLILMATGETYPRRLFWSFIFPLEALYLLGRKEGLLCIIGFFVIAATLVLSQNFGRLPVDYDIRFKLGYLISFFLVSLIAYFFEFVRFQYQEATEERQRSLEAANQQLRLEIAKRNLMEQAAKDALTELKETQTQLVQSAKLASIGELASGVAHELNQPLMVVRANVQLLDRTLKKVSGLSEDRHQSLGLIEANTRRMMNIINHLRTFSRQSQKEFCPVDVNSVMNDCFLMIGEQLRVHNVDVKLELGEHLPEVMGNANQLEQVFLNVIANARDAVLEAGTHENGAGTIKVVTGVCGKKREWIEALVRDNGKGITGRDLARIFEPFFTSKGVGKGTGLGLSISYGIIKDHQGEIEVSETGAEGTTFRIRLPVAAR